MSACACCRGGCSAAWDEVAAQLSCLQSQHLLFSTTVSVAPSVSPVRATSDVSVATDGLHLFVALGATLLCLRYVCAYCVCVAEGQSGNRGHTDGHRVEQLAGAVPCFSVATVCSCSDQVVMKTGLVKAAAKSSHVQLVMAAG